MSHGDSRMEIRDELTGNLGSLSPEGHGVWTEVERDAVIAVIQSRKGEVVRVLDSEKMRILRVIPKRWTMLHVRCLFVKRMTTIAEYIQTVWLASFVSRWRLLGLYLVSNFTSNMGFAANRPLGRDYLVI